MNTYLGCNRVKDLFNNWNKIGTIFFLLLIFQNCKKETNDSNCNDLKVTYFIADTIVNKIPYTGNEILVFVNSNKDTVKLEMSFKVSSFLTGNATVVQGNCRVKAFYNFENLKVFYSGNDFRLFNFEYRTYLDETIQNPIFNSIVLNINNSFLASSTYEYMSKKPNYDDSVLINNNYLFGKYLNDKKTALFNDVLGIIKFTDKNNMDWYLLKKESK